MALTALRIAWLVLTTVFHMLGGALLSIFDGSSGGGSRGSSGSSSGDASDEGGSFS